MRAGASTRCNREIPKAKITKIDILRRLVSVCEIIQAISGAVAISRVRGVIQHLKQNL